MSDIGRILERAANVRARAEEKRKVEEAQTARETALASFRERPNQFGDQLAHIIRPESYTALLGFITGDLPSDRATLLHRPETIKAWDALCHIGSDWYKYAPKSKAEAAQPMSLQEEAEFNKFIYLLEEFYYRGDFFQLTRHNSQVNEGHRFPTIGFDNTILAEFVFLINRLAKMRERNPRLVTFDRPRLQQFIQNTGEYAHAQGYDTDDFYKESEAEVEYRVGQQTPAFDMYFLKTSLIAGALIGQKLAYPDVIQMLKKLSQEKRRLEEEGYVLKPKPNRYYANLATDYNILNVDYVKPGLPQRAHLLNGSQFVHFDPETLPFHEVAMERLRQARS